MFCPACLKRVILIQPRSQLEIRWSEATRERQVTLVDLAEATTLLGARLVHLTESADPPGLGWASSTVSPARIAALPIGRLVSAA